MRVLEIFFGGTSETEIGPDGQIVQSKSAKIKALLPAIIAGAAGVASIVYSRPKNTRKRHDRKPFFYGGIAALLVGGFLAYKKLKK
jgi:hypothetical protein